MRHTVNISDAKARLSELVQQAEEGHEVIIARRNQPAVRLVPVEASPSRRLGIFAGRPYHIATDFDEELDVFEVLA
jgi:prevent-host-death family protein